MGAAATRVRAGTPAVRRRGDRSADRRGPAVAPVRPAPRPAFPAEAVVVLGPGSRSRAEVIRRLRFLPLSKDLRQTFQYCNLGYLMAGYAVETLAGTSWEDYLR